MISSIVSRPLGAWVSAPKKARSRPVAPQSLRRASRACTPSRRSLSVESCSSSALIASLLRRWGGGSAIYKRLSPSGKVLGPLQGGLVATVDLVPVDDVPERLDVLGPPVLVLEVVGVLPHVQAEDGRVAADEGRVLV